MSPPLESTPDNISLYTNDRETHLRLHQHQVNKQHHEIVLDVFVREALAPRALRQAHIAPHDATAGLRYLPSGSGGARGLGRGEAGGCGGLRGRVGAGAGLGGGIGRLVGPAVQDVVELRHRVAALDTEGHAWSLAW